MKKRKKKNLSKILIVLVIVIAVIVLIFIGKDKIFKKDDVKDNNQNTEINDNIDNNADDNEEEIIFNDYDVSNKTYDDVSVLQYYDEDAFNKDDKDKDLKPFILKRLNEFSELDTRIKKIIKNYDNYPEKLLMSLSMNIELTSFVIDYPSKKGKVYSEDVGDYEGNIPRLFQWDERWGYGSYGTSSIAVSGCGPTSLSMVVVALKKDKTVTPYKVAKLAEEKGYYVENSGTTWDLIREGAKDYGLKVNELPLSESSMKNALNNGHYIICNMRKGDFTINGHYIVIAGVENGKFKVNDPNSLLRSNMLWEFSRIKGQIKNLWELYL